MKGFRAGSALLGLVVASAAAGVLVAVSVVPAVAVTGVAAKNGVALFDDLPDDLTIAPLQQRSSLWAVEGLHGTKPVRIAEFYDEDRRSIPWSDVTPAVKDAALAAEDVRYYDHGAVDPVGILRAVIADARGEQIQGASTITQQYVKNICVQEAEQKSSQSAVTAAYDECVAPDVGRKLQEAREAIGLEQRYSKDRILLGYLNVAGFGGDVYGIEAAAEFYYGVDAKDLTTPQAASLLAILNDPADLRIDEAANIPADTARRDYILGQELRYRMIDRAAYDAAMAQRVAPHIHELHSGCDQAGVAGYFCTYVVSLIESDSAFGPTPAARYDDLYSAGWTIRTTLNLDLEKQAQRVVDTYVPKSSNAFDIGGAAVSVGVGTGRVLTMVENKDFSDQASAGPDSTAVNYDVDEADGGAGGIQPGSTYKLFTLIDWLEHGHTLDEEVDGSERTIPGSDFTMCGRTYTGSPWSVGDDEGASEDGQTSVLHATAESINGAFASMGEQLDLCDIRSTAMRFDVHAANGGTLNDYPASIIGTNYVAPLTMATAYAAMGDGGVVCTPVAITSVTTRTGRAIAVPRTDCTRAAPKDVVVAADDALRAVFTEGTAAGDSTPDGVYEVGKTGTTDGNANTWTVGTSNRVATAVWIGNVSGYTDLRTVYSTPYCALDGSRQAAIERHCVWRGIQTLEDEYYGGSSDSFGTPAPQFVGGIAAVAEPPAVTPVTPAPTPTPTRTPAPVRTPAPTPEPTRTAPPNH